jgi:Na+/melibiose symporter-like transporter
MKEILKKTLEQFVFVFIIFIILSFLGISIDVSTSNIFYTISGILFSIGISQVMTFDFSQIANDEKYKSMSNALNNVRNSFFVEFGLASIASLTVNICLTKCTDGTENTRLPDFIVATHSFSVEYFLNTWIVFTIIFFLFNYIQLCNKKQTLDNAIREEQKSHPAK